MKCYFNIFFIFLSPPLVTSLLSSCFLNWDSNGVYTVSGWVWRLERGVWPFSTTDPPASCPPPVLWPPPSPAGSSVNSGGGAAPSLATGIPSHAPSSTPPTASGSRAARRWNRRRRVACSSLVSPLAGRLNPRLRPSNTGVTLILAKLRQKSRKPVKYFCIHQNACVKMILLLSISK